MAQSQADGYVTPLYTGSPAPNGLAYYGLSEGTQGNVLPTVLQTTSLRGEVDMNAGGIQPQDLFQSSPDGFGIQLNAVSTNIYVGGTGGNQFWTQDVAEYFPTSGALYLVSNVWSFTPSMPLTDSTFYSTTLFPGCIDDFGIQGDLGYYYSECLFSGLNYPFDLTFYMTSSLSTGAVPGQNNITFEVDITQGGQTFAIPYDEVEFNSLAPNQAPLAAPSPYTADGFNYNPLGLTNDFELILGGPGGGSQADLASADATMSLGYWDSASARYVDIPSAFNYGGETGETAMGANVAWTSGPGGPGGLPNYATVSEGPSVLRGLWNAGAPSGVTPVRISVSPANAWFVVTPINASPMLRNFLISEPIAVSALYGQTLWLTPGTYTVWVGLSDYAPVTTTLTVPSHHGISWHLHLRPDFRLGVYTPRWAFSNSVLAAISFGGHGTAWDPYVLFNNQYRPLSSVFGLYNDYIFPTYPGVFLMGTTATTYLDHSADFTTLTNTFQYPGPEIPSTNQLQFWFWGVSHVALVDSTISGWFGSTTYYPAVDDSFNVIFYESSQNLVAGNRFLTEGDALMLASGGTYFGLPINIGGGNNTIWGNYFVQIATPTSTLSVAPVWYDVYVQDGGLYASAEAASLGMQISEDNDLIYNNYVATPTTAWMLPLNIYSGDPFFYTETWNITPQPAWFAHFAPGFPLVRLAGSIVGGSTQGGNYWWDYGVPNPYNGAVNPLHVLPYQENALTELVVVYGPAYYFGSYIYNGGDFAPLVAHGHGGDHGGHHDD